MTVDLRCGNVLDVLKTMPDESVHCVVTSPPYWGLRAYGTTPQVWQNGHEPCQEHQWGKVSIPPKHSDNGVTGSTLQGGKTTQAQAQRQPIEMATCAVCGAWRGELGLEPTPELYVEHLAAIFREVRRVMRDDATLWINIGDSYAGSGKASGRTWENGTIPKMSHKQASNKGSLIDVVVRPNLGEFLNRLIEGGLIFLAGSGSLTITAKSEKVLKANAIPPDVELSRFLGVKRILFKERNNDFCQVLNLFDAKRDVWISSAVSFVVVDDATLEIVADELDGLRVIVSDDDLQPTSAFAVFPVSASTGEYPEVGFTVAESGEPTTKMFRDIQSAGNTSTLDPFGKRFLQTDTVYQSVALADTLDASTCGLSNFKVTKSSKEHLALALVGGAVELAVSCVGHLFVSNKFGSLVRYGELYDKAVRLSNAQQPKQEMGIPEMVKRALMEDGWICRSTIIWAKPNPMPESVRDRPTKSHEYVFLLAKQPHYYYDCDAIREPQTESSHERARYDRKNDKTNKGRPTGKDRDDNGLIFASGLNALPYILNPAGRNKRSVWTVTTKPFKGAHFATFPPDLIEPMILAGTSERGVCPECGAPWERVTEREAGKEWNNPKLCELAKTGVSNNGTRGSTLGASGGSRGWQEYGTKKQTLGWRPTCTCDAGAPVPATVMDIFSGAGTTGVVAVKHGRNYVGIDLKPEYNEMAWERIDKIQIELQGAH